MYKLAFYWLATLTLCCFSLASEANLQISNPEKFWNASSELQGLSANSDLDARELAQAPHKFIPVEQIQTHSENTLWLRFDFSLANSATFDRWNALISVLPYSKLTLWLFQKSGGGQVLISKVDSFNNSNWLGSKQIIPIGNLNGGDYVVLFEMQGDIPLDLLFSTGMISDTSLALREKQQNYLVVFFCGGLFVMFVYSLILFFGMRERSYLFYCLLNLAYLSLAFTEGGLISEFLPDISARGRVDAITLSVGSITLFAGLFLANFIEPSYRRRWWVYPLIGTGVLFFLLSLLTLMPQGVAWPIQVKVRSAAFTVSQLAVLISLSYTVVKGSQSGKIALLAVAGPVTVSLLIIAMQNGLFDGYLFLQDAIYLGNLYQLLILSIGLLTQVRHLREDRDIATFKQQLSEENANTDPLTNLFNRRALFQRGNKIFDRHRNERRQMGVIIFDIDNFKQVNDDFGHDIGDDILCKVATSVANLLREEDLIARYGGEEFVVILPDADKEKILYIADRLRVAVEALTTPATEKLSARNVTISLGASNIKGKHSNLSDMIKTADTALFSAKDQGRNRVVWSNESLVSAL